MVTAATAAEFLAFLCKQGQLKFATIKVYRSALRSWWAQYDFSGAADPLDSSVVAQVLKGGERHCAAQELAVASFTGQRQQYKPPFEITGEFLEEIKVFYGRGDMEPHACLLWAAACVATYGLLRPSEMLGSQQHRDRALMPAAITWFRDEHTLEVRGMLPEGTDTHCRIVDSCPDRFTIDLGVTKTNQQGVPRPKMIAARPAVLALWMWVHKRRAARPREGDRLFQHPDRRPLSITTLTASIVQATRAVLHRDIRPTGKSFRRGGATTLANIGASGPDIQGAGPWRSPAMIGVYVSAAAQEASAARVSRAMAPAAVGRS